MKERKELQLSGQHAACLLHLMSLLFSFFLFIFCFYHELPISLLPSLSIFVFLSFVSLLFSFFSYFLFTYLFSFPSPSSLQVSFKFIQLFLLHLKLTPPSLSLFLFLLHSLIIFPSFYPSLHLTLSSNFYLHYHLSPLPFPFSPSALYSSYSFPHFTFPLTKPSTTSFIPYYYHSFFFLSLSCYHLQPVIRQLSSSIYTIFHLTPLP